MVLGITLLSHANPIDRQQALSKAKAFLNSRNINASLQPAEGDNVRSKAFSAQDEQDFYVFNIGQNEGFTIVAAEDNVPAILAYADNGSFSYDDMPDGLQSLLTDYSNMVGFARQTGQVFEIVGAGNAVEPIITATWGQGDPYNQACPLFVNGNRSITGCVATAMAMVLRHYGRCAYKTVQNQMPAYNCRTNWNGYGQIAVSSVPKRAALNWNEMPDNFNGNISTAQKDAVSKLMLYCGTAVNMDYRDQANGGSSAAAKNVPYALTRYFGYKSTIQNVDKWGMEATEWFNIIYKEIENNRPIILSGSDESNNGHTFICDGFDGESRFHINWGWNGSYNGYYLLTALTPANYPNGFNALGNATIGIEPIMPSDVNQDTKINSTDVVSVYNYILEGTKSGISSTRADVNQDFQYNSADVVNIYNDIIGPASSTETVFKSITAKGNAYLQKSSTYYYADNVVFTNKLPGTIKVSTIDLYINNQYLQSYTVNKLVAAGTTVTTGQFLFKLQYIGNYTTKYKFTYNGVEYEGKVDTPEIYAQ